MSDNPAGGAFKGAYVIDRAEVLRNTYRLLCVFFASKEIARRSHPDDPAAPLAALERRFFEAEASRLLLQVAIAARVIDDQIKSLPADDPQRIDYFRRLDATKGLQWGLFDTLDLDFRKTCNKIIHSRVMEPHSSEGQEPHELDYQCLDGDGPPSIEWKAFNGYVRLAGEERGKEWYVLLDIEVFVQGVFTILGP